MNDAVIFTILWCDISLEKGYRIYGTPDEMSVISKMYDDWCEKFYRGTCWEFDTPDHTELVLGMQKHIYKNI